MKTFEQLLEDVITAKSMYDEAVQRLKDHSTPQATPTRAKRGNVTQARWTQEENDEAMRMYEAGKSAAQIGRKLGRTDKAVHSRISRNNRQGDGV